MVLAADGWLVHQRTDVMDEQKMMMALISKRGILLAKRHPENDPVGVGVGVGVLIYVVRKRKLYSRLLYSLEASI
jgi:hypothetical protein